MTFFGDVMVMMSLK